MGVAVALGKQKTFVPSWLGLFAVHVCVVNVLCVNKVYAI